MHSKRVQYPILRSKGYEREREQAERVHRALYLAGFYIGQSISSEIIKPNNKRFIMSDD